MLTLHYMYTVSFHELFNCTEHTPWRNPKKGLSPTKGRITEVTELQNRTLYKGPRENAVHCDLYFNLVSRHSQWFFSGGKPFQVFLPFSVSNECKLEVI